MKEINNLKHLSHPNIVMYYGSSISEDGAVLSICMEFMSTSVESLLKKEGPMTWWQNLNFIPQFLKGLLHIHNEGLVHNDLKVLTYYHLQLLLLQAYIMFLQLRSESSPRYN